MAIVVNKDGGERFSAADVPLRTPNRIVAASPLNTLVPRYSGEQVQDSTTGIIWYALGLTNTSWTQNFDMVK